MTDERGICIHCEEGIETRVRRDGTKWSFHYEGGYARCFADTVATPPEPEWVPPRTCPGDTVRRLSDDARFVVSTVSSDQIIVSREDMVRPMALTPWDRWEVIDPDTGEAIDTGEWHV